MEDRTSSGLRVIIIGGAITGLTLAHCLEKAGIEYVLLEKHQDVRANLGGTIGLQPNGCRILDQLGVYDHLKPWRNDVDVMEFVLPGGFSFLATTPSWYQEWLGYPFTMVQRTGLLDTLYASLKDQSKIKLGTKVVHINPGLTPHGPLRVDTEDGHQYTGDIVVGADGVHGITRAQMWRMADEEQPGLIPAEERQSMKIDYICIFGVTEPTRSIAEILKPRKSYWASYPDVGWIVCPHADNTVSWFVNLRLDQTYVHPDWRRWSPEQVSARMQDFLDYEIGGSIKFRRLWERTTSVSSAPLHEGLMTTSTFGRIICVGDSVFKMTTVTGQGANLSMESAAGLANTLQQLSSMERKPSNAEIQAALARSAAVLQPKLRTVCAISHYVSRIFTLETTPYWFFLRYICPKSWRIIFSTTFYRVRNGQTVGYLPLPQRAIRASTRLTTAWKRQMEILGYGLGALIGIGFGFGIFYYRFLL